MPQLISAMLSQRIDLGELKSQLEMRLGPERSRKYFSYLHQLLSLKLTKREFDKLCFLTIGRENIPLHNQLIRSVMKNACQAKVPPPLKKTLQREDVLKSPHPQVLCNQEYLPQSPRRRRSITHRTKHGVNERTEVSVMENGDLSCHGVKRRYEGEVGEQAEKAEKIRRLDTIGSEEMVSGNEGDFTKRKNYLKLSHGPIEAPLGIPCCTASVSRAKLVENSSSCRYSSFSDSGELCNTEDLRTRMERIVERHGLGGVELDGANLLNYGLDAYLKQLIKSSIDLVRMRVDPDTINQPLWKQKAYDKPTNGIWLDSSSCLDLQERKSFVITLQDFTVAMKLNPQQLGQDAPLWLEKISFRSFE